MFKCVFGIFLSVLALLVYYFGDLSAYSADISLIVGIALIGAGLDTMWSKK